MHTLVDIIERALAELQTFSDPAFAAGIQQSVQKILKQDRGEETNSQSFMSFLSIEAMTIYLIRGR